VFPAAEHGRRAARIGHRGSHGPESQGYAGHLAILSSRPVSRRRESRVTRRCFASCQGVGQAETRLYVGPVGAKQDNMGRPPWSSREVVENCYHLSVDAMCREGVFASPAGSQWFTVWRDASGDEQFRIAYNVFRGPEGIRILHVSYGFYDTNSCSTKMIEYDISTTMTACHFGGERYWFKCPAVRHGVCCGRRVGRLYLPPDQRVFGCRLCHNLTYKSAQQHDKRKTALIRDSLALIGALESGDRRRQLLGIAACAQAMGRLKRLAP